MTDRYPAPGDPSTDLLAVLAAAVARARADYADRTIPDPVWPQIEADAADAAQRATDSLRAQGIIYPTHRVVIDYAPIRRRPTRQDPTP